MIQLSFRAALGAVLTILCAACVTPLPEETPEEPDGFNPRFYRLAVGDKIHVSIFREPDLSMSATIDASGAINYPLLGRVPVVGMTPPELEAKFTRLLKGDYLVNPDVRVDVVNFRPIYIVGHVARAGAYPFFDGMTVEKAIAIAGGLGRLASPRKIYVVRENRTRGEKEPARYETPLQPGDTIVVEESLF